MLSRKIVFFLLVRINKLRMNQSVENETNVQLLMKIDSIEEILDFADRKKPYYVM